MTALLVLLNNFMHDFSAAGWLFGTVILWVVVKNQKKGDRHHPTVIAVTRATRLLMLYCLGGIVGFGIVRLLAYKQYEWSAAAGEAQVTLLIVKHILLTAIFIFGVVFFRKTRHIVKIGDRHHEE
jgi:hypothetical protein